jgi:capsular polysaccharide biosynthesis protein
LKNSTGLFQWLNMLQGFFKWLLFVLLLGGVPLKGFGFNNLKQTIALQAKPLDSVQLISVLEEKEPFSSQFVATLLNGVVVNEGGILTQEGYIIEDTQTSLRDQHRLQNKNRDLSSENPLFFKGKLAVIASAGSENWYHWLLQILPRLIVLKEAQLEFDRIYINNLKYPWQWASLEAVLDYCQIDPSKMLIVNGDVVIQAEELLLPSVPFIPVKGTPLPHWLVERLRSIFLKKELTPPVQASRRIYISRKQASLRHIHNEAALIELLEGFGFQSVELEKLSPQEQALIFHQAQYIIGPHGSAFANLIFADPGYTLIEIDHGADSPRSFYKRLAEITGGLYLPFYVDHTTEEHLDEDMTVDLAAFKFFLETFLPHSRG